MCLAVHNICHAVGLAPTSGGLPQPASTWLLPTAPLLLDKRRRAQSTFIALSAASGVLSEPAQSMQRMAAGALCVDVWIVIRERVGCGLEMIGDEPLM